MWILETTHANLVMGRPKKWVLGGGIGGTRYWELGGRKLIQSPKIVGGLRTVRLARGGVLKQANTNSTRPPNYGNPKRILH